MLCGPKEKKINLLKVMSKSKLIAFYKGIIRNTKLILRSQRDLEVMMTEGQRCLSGRAQVSKIMKPLTDPGHNTSTIITTATIVIIIVLPAEVIKS